MQDHGIPDQRDANEALRRISRRTGIPLVISNDCHYLRKDDAFAHDVLLCIGTQKALADTDRLRYASDQFYLKSADEIAKLFPDDRAAMENTLAIAEACNLVIPTGDFQLPEFPVPAGYTARLLLRAGGARAASTSAWRSCAGSAAPASPASAPTLYRERLDNEIRIIAKMGFAGYFLVVWDFIKHARMNDIPVGPGRGSAAGSLVSYALRITDIDPLQYDLLFERFLNPERISMPDIDIDFCMRRRGEVINYVNEKYGRDKVAQIITFGTLAAKAVIRDVGRVMGLPYAKVDRIAKLVPDMTRSLAEAAATVEGLKAEAARDPEVRADRRRRQPPRGAHPPRLGPRRRGGDHAAADRRAGAALQDQQGRDHHPVGQGRRREPRPAQDGLPRPAHPDGDRRRGQDRPPAGAWSSTSTPCRSTTRRSSSCSARGAPTASSSSSRAGMKDLLRRAQPSKFEDLAAFNALYRPGALTSGMVEEYIQRKLGKKRVRVQPPRDQARSSRRPTASSSTRSR